MKLSLRWMCDHLSISFNKVNVPALTDYFNTKVAEIESVFQYTLDITSWYLGQVEKSANDSVTLSVPELKKQIVLQGRDNAVVGLWYLIKKKGTDFAWVTHQDVQIEKEGCLPAFFVPDTKAAKTGSWRSQIETTDIILDIDNKSITHRPDLWSHRGFAREVAPFLKAMLTPEKKLLAPLVVKQSSKDFKATKAFPFTITKDTKNCSFFTALYCDRIEFCPSVLWMGLRLARVDQRPIDYVVDATNYVMFDLGQPMHAFDAQKLSGTSFGPRMAKNGEQISLLSDINVTLQETDLVIADGKRPLALAGIKGGSASAVTADTTSLLLEAATFSGSVVRTSSCFHKLRTEGSARFEKELDPHQTIQAQKRFVALAQQDGVPFSCAPFIVALGTFAKPTVIEISQEMIESRLGVSLKKSEIEMILKTLGCKVTTSGTAKSVKFKVTVPSYRATKDIKIPEDLVEEVGRIFGYARISEKLPLFERKFLVKNEEKWESKLKTCKDFLAFTGKMKEVCNYALLDNDFVKKINWQVMLPVEVLHPLSQQATMLVDSLVVPLLQNIDEVSAHHEQIAFFEWARTWSTDVKKVAIYEQKVVAGIIYQRKQPVDFYKGADLLTDLYTLLGMSVQFKKSIDRPLWAHRYQCADLVVNKKVVGKVAAISLSIMNKLGGGYAWAFELDGEFLLHQPAVQKTFVPLLKYQKSYLDISMMVPLSCSVESVQQAIKATHTYITHVQLQDVFQRPEWKTTKSMTFRFFIEDPKQAVSKELLATIQTGVEKMVTQKLGAEIR